MGAHASASRGRRLLCSSYSSATRAAAEFSKFRATHLRRASSCARLQQALAKSSVRQPRGRAAARHVLYWRPSCQFSRTGRRSGGPTWAPVELFGVIVARIVPLRIECPVLLRRWDRFPTLPSSTAESATTRALYERRWPFVLSTCARREVA